LSVLVRFTDHDYPFSIFKLFLILKIINKKLQKERKNLPSTIWSKNKLPHLSPKSNIKIVERGQNDTSNTQIHEKQHKITNQICFYFLLDSKKLLTKNYKKKEKTYLPLFGD
jgi:hypothetical protein